MEARLEAANNGKNKYDGKPCGKCGGTLRWVINNSCVPCATKAAVERDKARRRMLKDALEKARERGL